MLGATALSATPLSAYDELVLLINNINLKGEAKLDAIGQCLVNASNVNFYTTADIDVFTTTVKEAVGQIHASALLNVDPDNEIDVFGINIKGEAKIYVKGLLLGEGWVRVVPDTEEWTNTTNW